MKNFFELTDNMSLYTPECIRSICKAVSLKAKCLYELLLRRTGLSIHNGEKWYTPNLGVFVIYPREEAAKMLGCSLRTVTAVFRQLVSAGLIFEERPGQGKANRIYVCKPDLPETAELPKKKSFRKSKAPAKAASPAEAPASEPAQRAAEPLFSEEESYPVKKKKTPHKRSQKPQESRRPQAPAFFVSDEIVEDVKKRIEYPFFAQNAKSFGITKKVLDMIVRCLSELLAAPTTRVNGIVYSWEECDQLLEGLDSGYIDAFITRFRETSFEQVHNCKAYVKSMLFNFMDEWAVQLQSWDEEIRMGINAI